MHSNMEYQQTQQTNHTSLMQQPVVGQGHTFQAAANCQVYVTGSAGQKSARMQVDKLSTVPVTDSVLILALAVSVAGVMIWYIGEG